METEFLKLDISSLKLAVASLGRSIEVSKKCGQDDSDLAETIRSGVIQNFEIAYGACWKYMKRWLEINMYPGMIMGMPRREFYRIAFENKLIDNREAWWKFHEARNLTSHVYDGEIASDVYDAACEFLPYAETFVNNLEARL